MLLIASGESLHKDKCTGQNRLSAEDWIEEKKRAELRQIKVIRRRKPCDQGGSKKAHRQRDEN